MSEPRRPRLVGGLRLTGLSGLANMLARDVVLRGGGAMALVVNMHDAKTHLSRLVARAAAGEQMVIARAGRPAARLVPYVEAPRRPGVFKGSIRLAPSFDDPLPEELFSPWPKS